MPSDGGTSRGHLGHQAGRYSDQTKMEGIQLSFTWYSLVYQMGFAMLHARLSYSLLTDGVMRGLSLFFSFWLFGFLAFRRFLFSVFRVRGVAAMYLVYSAWPLPTVESPLFFLLGVR